MRRNSAFGIAVRWLKRRSDSACHDSFLRLVFYSVVAPNRGPALILAIALPGVLACNVGRNANPIREAFADSPHAPDPGTPIAFRFPSAAGSGVRIYALPGMDELPWQFETPSLATQQVVGFAPSENQVYVYSAARELVALDLVSGRDRILDTAVAAATLGPTGTPHVIHQDGNVATIVDRRIRNWDPILPTLPQGIWGTTRGRMLAFFDSEESRRLELVGDSSRRITAELPEGPLAATTWGDLVVIGVDSGLVAIRTDDGSQAGFLSLTDEVTAVTFSSSGHRVYATTTARELLVVGRFGLELLSRYPLPDGVEALRADGLGRYLLMRPVDRDSVWIVDALQISAPLSIEGSWDDELPSIGPDATVLLRQRNDVIAVDPATGRVAGRVPNGASDRWLAAVWEPLRPALQLASEADAPSAVGISDQDVYVQLSSTSNESWAQARVDELRGARLTASVLQPNENYDRYRVVLGPFPTREAADNIGRRLGQPYSIIFLQDTTATNR